MTSRINFTIGPAADRHHSATMVAPARFSPRGGVSRYYVRAERVSFWLLVSVCSGVMLAVWVLS